MKPLDTDLFLFGLLGALGHLFAMLLGLILQLVDPLLQTGFHCLQRFDLLSQDDHLVAELVKSDDEIVLEYVQSVPWNKFKPALLDREVSEPSWVGQVDLLGLEEFAVLSDQIGDLTGHSCNKQNAHLFKET